MHLPSHESGRAVADAAAEAHAVVDGRAARRRVTIGRQNGYTAQVLDGLSQGEQVILHPTDRIADGVRVERRIL